MINGEKTSEYTKDQAIQLGMYIRDGLDWGKAYGVEEARSVFLHRSHTIDPHFTDKACAIGFGAIGFLKDRHALEVFKDSLHGHDHAEKIAELLRLPYYLIDQVSAAHFSGTTMNQLLEWLDNGGDALDASTSDAGSVQEVRS